MAIDGHPTNDRRTEILAAVAVSAFFFLCMEMTPGQALVGLDWPWDWYYIALAILGLLGGAYASWDFLKKDEVPFFIAVIPGMATGILMCCAGGYLVSKAMPVGGRVWKFLMLLAFGATLLPGLMVLMISCAATSKFFGKGEISSPENSPGDVAESKVQDSQSVDPSQLV